MTKQDRIKEACAPWWNHIKDYLDEDGWFDSVGLYIEPLIIDRDWWGYDIVEEDLMGGHYESTSTPMELEFKTRQEALTHAIETANKIYNERR